MKKVVLGIVLTVFAGALLEGVASASSSPVAINSPAKRGGVERGARESVRDYWTPQRLAEARPLAVLETEPSPSLDPWQRPRNGFGTRGGTFKPGYIPPDVSSPVVDGEALGRGAGVVTDYRSYPQRTNGKLFARQGPFDIQCSASVVASGKHDLVITAGHCIHDWLLGWSKKLLFIPAYNLGARPYGTWVWRRAVVPSQWLKHSNFNFDYGAVALKSSSRGQVGRVVGENGVAWNVAPRLYDYRAIGYPKNSFRGKRMYSCLAPFHKRDRERDPGPSPISIRCLMQRGASGGGWTIEKGNSTLPYVNSVTSYGYKGSKATYGPYFTPNIGAMIRFAERRR